MTPAERAVSFFYQPVASRAAVVAAGPIANFILAIVIFAGIFAIYGKPSTAARVDTVQENSAAAAAGFKPGDVVTTIDGARHRQLFRHAAHRFDQRRQTAGNPGRPQRRTGDAVPRRRNCARSRTVSATSIVSAFWGSAGPWAPRRRRPSRLAYSTRSGSAPRNAGSWSIAPCPTSAGSLPAAKPPTNSAGRSALPRFPARSRRRGLTALLHLAAVLVGLDRPAEPVSGAVARWRAPFVLRNRGGRAAVRCRSAPRNMAFESVWRLSRC